MNKLFVLASLLMIVLSTGCSANTESEVTVNNIQSNKTAEDSNSSDSILKLSDRDISRICIKNTEENMEHEYTNSTFIKEFCSFLKNQKYASTDAKFDVQYYVRLLYDKNEMLKISFGEWEVEFDRDFMIGQTLVEKGRYKVEQWIWDSLKKFYQGQVLDPQYIEYPAKLKLPVDSCEVEIIDSGSNKVNVYEIYPHLYSFVEKYFCGNEFEIVRSKKINDYKAMEVEKRKAENEQKCFIIHYASSENYIEIDSGNEYRELSKGTSLILSEHPEEPGVYKLFTNKMVLDIKTSDDFSSSFKSIFSLNGSTFKELTPGEIEELFNQGSPYYMEYISRNLGIEDWKQRYPDTIERQSIILNNYSRPYTVVCLSSPFSMRMLIFNQKRNNTWNFIGSIDFGGRMAGTEYHLEEMGDNIWIVGNRCGGHGTGESRYYQQWYTVSDSGCKLVMAIPYDEYMVAHFGGYHLKADNIRMQEDDDVKIVVDYTVTKIYHLDLDNADENGQVKVSGKKSVEFKWDDTDRVFFSEYPTDERGVTQVPVEIREITNKCNKILKTYYSQILCNLKAMEEEENENIIKWKIRAVKIFLDDCTDCMEKNELNKQIEMLE